MFSDLNRFVQQTSKSLGMLYDRRDNLSALTMEVSEQVDVFRGTVDKEKITILLRSPKLFTISALYEANEELLGKNILNRDHRPTQNFSRPLSNTDRAFKDHRRLGKSKWGT
jgi:hypothetical protein